ncbi:MAG: Nif3-like dinuclear metal center hexameric protein [Chitinophagales bacterium]|nr:Nif3-like dinuclear metal center hexameric protein [Chitinophagales bacterium]MDW8428542.1 Nif3-like dinuclear metal center hexameric protein [Chitinophagales bacterium]
MKLKTIVEAIESFAPLALQESYDNSGLICGDWDMEISSALIALDLTDAVLDEALAAGCNLIITHHPLVFHALKKFPENDPTTRLLLRAIRHHLAIYAAHTSLDNSVGGVSYFMATKLALTRIQVLSPVRNQLMKLITFVPHQHAAAVRQALFDAGAGHIGDYDQCSFNVEGYGTFRGAAGTNPYVGQPGIQHREEETRIEVILPAFISSRVLKALKESHPYEEVAYDLVPLANDWQYAGAGIIGELPRPMTAGEFLTLLKQTFRCAVIRHSTPLPKPILNVALCGGAGSFLLDKAIAAGADAFVTADVGYHRFFEAQNRTLLCDIGHYESEQFTAELLLSGLKDKLPTFAARISAQSTNPVNYFS